MRSATLLALCCLGSCFSPPARFGRPTGDCSVICQDVEMCVAGICRSRLTTFELSSALYSFEPVYIRGGPDGNLWFTEHDSRRIGRITTEGVYTGFDLPTHGPEDLGNPFALAVTATGDIWYTQDLQGRIGHMTPAGVFNELIVPGAAGTYEIAIGSDQNPWVGVDTDRIVRVNPDQTMSTFGVPGAGDIGGVAAGPDGAIWFTRGDNVGRLAASGQVDLYPVPTREEFLGTIAAGPDGNLWFLERWSAAIGRITPAGSIREFPVPGREVLRGVTGGPDGNIWYVYGQPPTLGRVTPDGEVTTFPLPENLAPYDITTGPDGNLWFTSMPGKIGRFVRP
jgi:virginiamycin B lyase